MFPTATLLRRPALAGRQAARFVGRRQVARIAGRREDESDVNANAATTEESDSADATTKDQVAPKASRNPWRHFQAFESMDEYVDTTLIHYDNRRKTTEES